MGYTIGINQPYSGSIVPMAFYHKDCRVTSIMVEVNRKLYMDEMTGTKKDAFEATQKNIQTILSLSARIKAEREKNKPEKKIKTKKKLGGE